MTIRTILTPERMLVWWTRLDTASSLRLLWHGHSLCEGVDLIGLQFVDVLQLLFFYDYIVTWCGGKRHPLIRQNHRQNCKAITILRTYLALHLPGSKAKTRLGQPRLTAMRHISRLKAFLHIAFRTFKAQNRWNNLSFLRGGSKTLVWRNLLRTPLIIAFI